MANPLYIANPTEFTVTITANIDDQREEKYAQEAGAADANNPEDYWPTDKAAALEIAKANIRYHAMIDQLSLMSLFNIFGIERTGRTKDTPASELTFKLDFYRDRVTYLKTEDELNPGTYLTGIDAIKRCIARALSVDYNQNYSFWDPTVTVTRTNTNTTNQTTPPRGWAYEMVLAEKEFADVTTAEAAITVVQDS